MALAALVLLSATSFVQAEVQLLEGFEDLKKVRVRGSKRLTAVKAPDAVTQGKQAARLPVGAAVRLSIPQDAAGKFQWLRIDTMTLGPVPQAVRLVFSAKGFWVALYAYVQPGRDTLALPLSEVRARTRADWPQGAIGLTVGNSADAALIVDNIRIETASVPPAECTLIDFGPERQSVWPGFAPGDRESESVTWSGKKVVYDGVAPLPDPLGKDYIGPYLGNKAIDSFVLASKQEKTAVWLWVTHYGWRRSQPLEYIVRAGGRSLLNKRMSRRQALGPDGLLIGLSGPWTPEWFDSQYAGKFVQLLNFTLGAGKGIDLGNCQLAALATAPLSKRSAMKKYIKGVQGDLSRYRRQFVVGYVRRVRCEVAPEVDEESAGVMVFAPPPGSRYMSDWSPGPADRAKVMKVLAPNGGTFIAPLAIVPLRASSSTSASLSTLRSERQRALTFDKGSLAVRFLQRVPRVRQGAVGFQPWLLVSKCPALKPREVVFMVLTGRLRPNARAGVYRGRLSISVAGKRSALPVEIEVVDLGAEEFRKAAIGGLGRANSSDFYRGTAYGLSPVQRGQLTMRLRRQLLVEDVDALTLSGAYINTAGKISSGSYKASLNAYPIALTKAPTLLGVQNAGEKLIVGKKGRVASLRNTAVRAIKVTVELAKKAGVTADRSYLYWYGGASLDGDDRMVVGTIRDAGGRGILLSSSSVIRSLGDAAKGELKPWAALILTPNTNTVAQSLAQFKKMGEDRRAYIYAGSGADRYLCGFYPSAVGADGCYVRGLSTTYGMPFDGFHVSGSGVLAPQDDGTLVATLALLRIWQGRDDADIMRRCEAILAKSDKAAAAAKELAAVLKKIRDHAIRHNGVYYSSVVLRTTAVSPRELDVWREELLRAGAKLVSAGAGSKK